MPKSTNISSELQVIPTCEIDTQKYDCVLSVYYHQKRQFCTLAISLQKQKSFVFAPSKIFFSETLTSQFLHNKRPKKISISLCFEIHPIIQMYSGFTINCNNLKSTTLGQEPASIIHCTRPGSNIKRPNQKKKLH